MNAVNPLVSSGNSDSRQNKTTYHGRRRKKIVKIYVIKTSRKKEEENIQDICNKNILTYIEAYKEMNTDAFV